MRTGALVITAFVAAVFAASASPQPSRRAQTSGYALRLVTVGAVKRVSILYRSPSDTDQLNWRFVDLSPDRRRALMILSEGFYRSSETLFVTDIRGRAIRQMMSTTSFTPRAEWSPDGARFYYMTASGESCNAFTFSTAAPDGRGVRTLGSGALFAWGAGHRSFAIEQGCDEVPSSYRLTFTNRAGRTFEIARGWAAGMAVSPRGDRIAYETYDTASGIPTLHIAYTGGRGRIASIRRASSAAWSADGSRIAFVRPVGQMTWEGSIAVGNANGRGVRVVARGSGPGDTLGMPAWSPNGRRVAFVHEHSALETVQPNGRGRRLIVEQRNIRSIWWSRDSSRIYYDGTR